MCLIRVFIACIFAFCTTPALLAQDYDAYKFLSYGALPTWSAVAIDWQTSPKAYIYDANETRGHAEFVKSKLGRAITFQTFKELSGNSAKRQYMPFFIYDLRLKPIIINKIPFDYAVRLEDYEYDDSPEMMSLQVYKLMKLVGNIPFLQNKKGLIVVGQRHNDPLNVNAISKYLQARDVAYTTLNQLIKHVGGKKMEVLNGVKAVGHLVKVQSEAEMATLNAHDIAIFSFTPKRIPPLAGIITLVPQTPLSHINLLAKNRNTLNMYVTNLSFVPELTKYLGKDVEINPLFQKLTIKPVSQKYVASVKTNHPAQALQLVQPQADFESVIPLTPAFKNYQQVKFIGAKATNYALMYEILGEKLVHQGYALGFGPYLEVLSKGANKEIHFFLSKKSTLNYQQKKQALARIRQVILQASIPAKTLASIRTVVETHFPKGKVKLRSSTNCEDLPTFNGAGLYDSKGFKTQESDVVLNKKLLQVYASLWNDEAFEEREHFGMNHEQAAMAVLISPAFVGEYANGVILATPNGTKPLRILVNAQIGEHEVTNPKKGEIPEAFLVGAKGGMEKMYSRSNVGKVFVGNVKATALLKSLRENTLKIHEALSKRQKALGGKNTYSTDIEFKIVKDKNQQYFLYFKQARLLKSKILPE